ncbi:MBL fold metallo-hydrolase [Aggregatilinea lenta]|uniref:MBL fold metallo-hydrolase n=1 Tax=Aggregatilinea lenta TaxID=913108 RepID=UPI000E5B4115|nr:MBL fold metallo-hydrolase [Aggregatilinea lenta]
MIDRIQWLGHGSFRIQGPPLIYINPWRLARNAFHADVVLISNDQYDHCSPADVEKLRGPDTVIIANTGAANMLGNGVVVLRPWQSMCVGNARITAVPAYTFTNHHPVSEGGLGFIVSLDYYDIYYAGSTDLVPELDHIQADIAIVPVGTGQGTMTLDRTARFVEQMKPGWVIPSHWGTIGGTQLDAQALSRTLDHQTNVIVLEKTR